MHCTKLTQSILYALALTFVASRVHGAELPRLKVDLNETSVSGLSSGAYMAAQFQIAHSDQVKGAGIVAGGPYGCAYDPATPDADVERALGRCMHAHPLLVPTVKNLEGLAQKLAAAGAIAPLSGLSDDKVYLFSGTEDTTVEPPVVERAAELYRSLGVLAGNIVFKKTMPAGHAFITENIGAPCRKSQAPFINNCGYDQAEEILQTIYDDRLNGAGSEEDGEFIEFDQTRFGGVGSATDMADVGIAFVPAGCRRNGKEKEGCRPHVVFHGCEQSKGQVGDAAHPFYKASGYARWAVSNRIVLLFPQIAKKTCDNPGNPANPKGCWDWWGYTGTDFLSRSAPQIRAVHAMLQHLAQ